MLDVSGAKMQKVQQENSENTTKQCGLCSLHLTVKSKCVHYRCKIIPFWLAKMLATFDTYGNTCTYGNTYDSIQ